MALESLRTTSARLIEKFGRTVTLRRIASTPVDPLKPWHGPDASAAVEVEGPAAFVAIEYNDPRKELVQDNDVRILIAADVFGAVPDMGDEFLDGSSLLKIGAPIIEIKPGESSVIYDLILRA